MEASKRSTDSSESSTIKKPGKRSSQEDKNKDGKHEIIIKVEAKKSSFWRKLCSFFPPFAYLQRLYEKPERKKLEQEYKAISNRIPPNQLQLEIRGKSMFVSNEWGQFYPPIPVDIRELRDLIKQLQSAEKELQPKPTSTHLTQPQSLQHSCGHLNSEVKTLLDSGNSKEDTLRAPSTPNGITNSHSQKSQLSH